MRDNDPNTPRLEKKPGRPTEPMRGGAPRRLDISYRRFLHHTLKVAGVVLASCLILCAIAVIAVSFIEQETIRERLIQEAGERLNADVAIGNTYLSVLPSPHLTLHDISIDSLQWGQMRAATVELHPRLIRLLRKQVVLKRCVIRDVTVDLHLGGTTPPPAEGTSSIERLRRLLQSGMSVPLMEIVNGRICFTPESRQPGVSIEELSGTITEGHGDDLLLDVRFTTSCSKRVELKGMVNTGSGDGSADVSVVAANPVPLVRCVTQTQVPVVFSPMDIRGHVDLQAWSRLQADLQGDGLSVRSSASAVTTVLRTAPWTVSIVHADGQWTCVLNSLTLLNPRATLNGMIKTTPGSHVAVAVEGRDLDISGVRETALKLCGHNEVVALLFSILRAGSSPHVVCTGEGATIQEALSLEHLTIRGAVTDGRVVLPVGQVPLDGVSGSADVTQGYLKVRDAEARIRTSTLQKGTVTVGLTRSTDTLHVECELDAKVTDVVRYLPAIVQDDHVTTLLRDLGRTEGWAKGTLAIQGTLSHPVPQVDIHDLHLLIKNDRIGPPLLPMSIRQKGGEIKSSSPLRLRFSNNGIGLWGTVVWKADRLFWPRYTWRYPHGMMTWTGRSITMQVLGADLCGIKCHGSVSFAARTTVNVGFGADDIALSPVLGCLWGSRTLADGTCSIDGTLKAKGRRDPLAEYSRGRLTIRAAKGRIYRWTLLSKLFGALNVMEWFRGNPLDLNSKGFRYDRMTVKGDVRNGVLYLTEAVIDGPSMKIVGEGAVDTVKGQVDLTVVVAPMKTVDTVLSSIPVLGYILTGESGTFASVPLRVQGPIDDPTVTPFPPSAVGNGLLGVLKRTVQAPVKVISPGNSK